MKLDFYTKRSQLDEMQEQKLCKLESRGFWLLWWGLLAAIIVQSLVGEPAHPPHRGMGVVYACQPVHAGGMYPQRHMESACQA